MRSLAVLVCLVAVPAAAQTLILRPEVCTALVDHRPGEGAAYRAGADIHGRSVAPADLPAASGAAFDEIAIKLTVDLKRRFGIPADDRFFGEAELGYVTVRGGKAFLNGAPLATESEAALAALCRRGPGPWRDPPR